ncbi:isopenicillin N synthase family oxygenase [Frankia sp. CNm7]|uniref:Isopenicillin N synthase family oxygenase n=1 Tax=Frankia nepalensis TaxID=1836974 RepID=A0A937UN03_9ACTN|nr:2-oxoglutarate and iron-dependent oxygenase domain-containing protein [Frankia nepalensis]MBL7498067.1 isopenicillin N synthase family oxygenase [Frankia nepalensis]MBL7513715.1 isopenicillin N synthase family oxygenase [Frankia nepalensis]MBL7523450.1 isopenicillin N synthase family oxygenase [Frankia nepalensis]MBL7629369.1 isopenicillin N synthase family oxygenase [Frankia nepalensis]
MADLRTFQLPDFVDGGGSNIKLADELIQAWRTDGILQVATDPTQDLKTKDAIESSRRFFGMPAEFKRGCVSDLTYSGYIASGEEQTAGESDYSEIFTVCPDVPLDDPRVLARRPCHGPAPWPDGEYRRAMLAFMAELGTVGEKLLKLTALGLGVGIDALTDLTKDGWHHMRVLRFPARSEHTSRGIGAHTDYGLLVIAAQDDVGGLYIRPPVHGERRSRNWLPGQSMAGRYENEDPWTYVKPVPSVFTVFPGDMLQLITDGFLLSTPHKVILNTRERFALAYFHEPNFQARVRPLSGGGDGDHIHYGRHFTSMFMRSYPERITTRRIVEEDRLSLLVP